MKLYFACVCLFALLISGTARAQTVAFTYQGRLTDGLAPASGTYEMQFSIWDSASGGGQIGTTITNSSVSVANGVFTVQLDFSPATPFAAGADRWLEIAVKKPVESSFTTLSPRQQITSSPYSIRTISASVADSLSASCVGCVANSHINSMDAAKLTGAVDDARLSANVTKNDATQTLTNKTIDSPTNSVSADKIRTATTTVNVGSATAPTSGQVLTATSGTSAAWQPPFGWTPGSLAFNANGTLTMSGTSGAGSPVLTTTSSAGWVVGGNTLTSTGIFGTLSNSHVDLYTGNTVRGRLSNLGEFFIGTTSTVIAGDLFAAQGNVTFPWAVSGYTTFNGGGVYGAVQGGTTGFSGVEGDYQGSGSGSGVFGNYTGSAISATNPTGVNGVSNPTVPGNGRIGVRGTYNSAAHFGIGVIGIGIGGGVPAGNLDFGVVGWVGNGLNYAGYFNGNQVVVNGAKSASVATSRGNQLFYVTETPEVWFEDIGGGQLVNGTAEIKLDPLFLETVVIDDRHPMHVFIQMEDESEEVFVKKGVTSFKVIERNGGTSNASFSYRVMAKRVNFQDHRFGNDPVWGPGDTRKYTQYVPPPSVDYETNLKFQEERRRNWKPQLMPPGFKYLRELPAEARPSESQPQN